MLSNKLTFSLALVVMLALIAGPALAQTDDYYIIPAAEIVATSSGNFYILEKDGTANGITAQVADANRGTIAFNDLEEVLTLGGTIELLVEIAEDDGVAATGRDAALGASYVYPANMNDNELSTWVENNLKAKFVITEIMWGLDAMPPAAITTDPSRHAQWIEIYNNTAPDPASGTNPDTLGATAGSEQTVALGITLNQRVVRSFMRDTAGDIDSTNTGRVYAVVDRVSTIDFRGTYWAPLGQSGRTNVGTNGEERMPLISMHRRADLTRDDNGNTVYNNTEKFGQVAVGAVHNQSGDGTDAASWAATPENRRLNVTGRYYVGTPGSAHLGNEGDVSRFNRAAVGAADDAGRGVIINEFRNDTTAANEDWIEIINNEPAGSAPLSVNGWRLWLITPDNADADDEPEAEVIAILPNYRIAPGSYLLIVNQDPEDSSLAAGRNINAELQGTVINSGAEHVYFISDFTLPNDGPGSQEYLLVLRRGGQTNYHENFEDFAGNGFFEYAAQATELYPLRGWQLPRLDRIDDMFEGMLMGNMSYGRTFDPVDDPATRNVARSRAERLHQDDWQSFGAQGGIGYDPEVMGIGTPGYANWVPNQVIDDRRDSDADDDRNFDGTVTFSEIMYDGGDRDNLAQWIELYNSSTTHGINIGGWELEIRNKNLHPGDDQYVDHVLELDAMTIPPNRTLLLVSRPVNNRNRSLDSDDDRLYDLYQAHAAELGLNLLNSRLLSPHGFYLELRAPSEMSQGLDLVNPNPDVVMDMVGNLMLDRNGDPLPNEWELSDIANNKERMAGEPRNSIVRLHGGVYGGEGYAFTGTKPADPGTAATSWRGSSGHQHSPESIFYGQPDDISTPGFRRGGPLPVELASFRPVRDAVTGHVVIRWATESELNNAGFNILRSETKRGTFKVVNVKGIVPGHGTTSEKHVYEWTDTTAKPNVVYYYQIEDVSLDGNRTTLATTHLRGNVTAAGKVTTTWGDLKTRN